MDGRHLPRAGAARRRPRALRAAGVLLTSRCSRSCRSRSSPSRSARPCTLLLVNVFPATARARHPDAHGPAVRGEPRHPAAVHPAGAAAAGRVAARRHRLLRDAAVADHAAAAVVLGRRSAVRGPAGRPRLLHVGALWTTALALDASLLRAANERWHFAGYSRAQEAPKARFTKLRSARSRWSRALPLSPVRRQLLVKDSEDLPARRQPVVAAPAARSRWCWSISTTSACSISSASRT